MKKEVFASESDYTDALKAHHAVMQAAMKCKQTVDSSSMLLEILRRRISLRNEEINYAGNRDSNVHYLRRL